MEDEDDILLPDAASPSPPDPGAAQAEGDDPPEAAPPELVRIEFPVRVVVVGSLRQADIDRVTDAVLAELQAAIEGGP